MLMNIQRKKTHLYFHQPTGNIRHMTKKEAKAAGAEWHRVQFVTNDQGVRVMRFQFTDPQGVTATVDITETEETEVKDGQPVTN